MKTDILSKIRAGDKVIIDGLEGVVVFSSITDTYSDEYPKSIWCGKENEGIMIEQENGARIFHDTEYLHTEYCRIERL
ncbi:MAG: hypothetical protein AAGB07_02970 [Pseudomonadota bacterium]